MPSNSRTATRTEQVRHVLWLCFLACSCASTGGGSVNGQASEELQGSELLAAANEMLAPRARELDGVSYLDAICVRTETVPGRGGPFVDSGSLMIRRDPPCAVLQVRGRTPRRILEDSTMRLVLEANYRRATRWTYDHNARGPLAVAALFVDIGGLTSVLRVAACERAPDDGPEAMRVELVPLREDGTIQRLELVFVKDQAVPRRIVVLGAGGGVVEYDVRRPNIDPPWRDPAARFSTDVPSGYSLREYTGE